MSKSIVAAIEKQEGLASSQGDLSEQRNDAIDHYLGRLYGDEQEGRSSVVMRDVADTIEWIKPSLMKVFCAGDEVVRFDPVGPEDEKQSEQETDYCNYLLMQKNNGFLVLHDWFHDALLQKNGYVMAQYVTEKASSREVYKGLSDDEFALMLQNEPELEVLEHTAYPDPIAQAAYGMPIMGQEQVQPPPVPMYHDCVVKCMREYGQVKVQNIAPERVLIAGDWPGVNLEGCPFVEVIDYPTISYLRQCGYEVDDNISDTAAYNEDEWSEQRRAINDEDQSLEDIEADPSTRRVKTRYVWMLYDEDEDGIAELRRVVVVGTTVLENEEDDICPVAALTPIRMPHEHYGLSIDDIVHDLQKIRTTLTRGFLDNMYLANNGRYAIDANVVNLDDMLTSRPGGVVRVNGSAAGGAIMPLVHPQEGGQILQAIEYVDTIRENRTGVTKYNQGMDSNSLNKTASGVTQIMTAAQQRIELIARMFAETGVKALMLIIHAMSIKNGRKQEVVKLRNEWVTVDPRNWKNRRDLTVSVGLGTGNKDQMLQHLMMILQAQQQAAMIGVASPQNIYNALVKLTQNAGFKNPDDFWTDPSKAAPQQKGPSPEEIKVQGEMQKTQMETQADAQKFQAETQRAMQMAQQQMAFDASEREKDRQAELEKVRMQEATKVILARENAEHSMGMEQTKHAMTLDKQEKDNSPVIEKIDGQSQALSDVISELVQVMHGLKQDISRPRVPIRDAKGKVIGARMASDDEQLIQ